MSMQNGPYPMAVPGAAPAAPAPKKGSPALVVTGALLLCVALGAAGLFAYNLYQYATADAYFADLAPHARDFAVALVKGASVKRMIVFGPVAALFGAGGLVAFVLGVRRRA